MQKIISKERVIAMIESNIDYDYEIFQIGCDYVDGTRESLMKMPKIYQLIYSTTVIEGEIYNGGLYQYCGNSTAQEFNEMGIEYFKEIGAINTAKSLSEVFSSIINQSQTFRTEYMSIGIQNAFNKASDVMDEIDIEKYDDVLYGIWDKENPKELRLDFIKQNLHLFD